MWWLPQTSDYSYLRVAAIRIDIHPAGEYPANMPHVFHAQSADGLRHTYLMWSTHSNFPYGHQQIWTYPLHPRKKTPDTIHNTPPTDRSTGRPSFSPTTAHGAVGKSQTSVDIRLLGLSDLYHWHAIDTFNTCSRGSTHRSLTDTGGGYNLESSGLPHTTPWPSQPVVSTFP
jgi:hypothetical protein